VNADDSTRRTSGRDRVVRTRRRPDLSRATLSEADRHLLDVLCRHRVVRQDQLARLLPDIRERTLRYRTRRLHDLGLMGRTRPYRERGSAPNHHWPTRRADCMMNGDALPRGGERRAPNPLFLAHGAGLTELYVTLATNGPGAGFSLVEYRLEADAREPFKHLGKQRALTPDAFVVLADEHERELEAFVELDLGTMSHARLRKKANLYAAYTAADVWRERHLFLAALRAELTESRRHYSQYKLAAGAGAVALEPARLLDDACLVDRDGEESLTLRDVLEVARAPYDRIERANRKRQETQERKRAQLREDPAAARKALQRFQGSHAGYLEELGATGRRAAETLIASTDTPAEPERAALDALVADLENVLVQPGGWAPSPGSTVKRTVDALVPLYRERHQRLIDQLAARYGQGPSIRRARKTLQDEKLLDHRSAEDLPEKASRDAQARDEQERRRVAYLEWREQAARKAGPMARLTRSREDFYPQIDDEQLRECKRCKQTIYPQLDQVQTATGSGSAECPFCPDIGGAYVVFPHADTGDWL
jgi:Replication-relaxation